MHLFHAIRQCENVATVQSRTYQVRQEIHDSTEFVSALCLLTLVGGVTEQQGKRRYFHVAAASPIPSQF